MARNEIFRTDSGNEITVQQTWAGIRIVLHKPNCSTIGKHSFSSFEAAYEELRANSKPA